jgi:lipopolysaccharide/colanic/teichoic acid biosynthesis glycosyltransferase
MELFSRTLAIFILATLLPVLFLIALINYITMGRPVIYRQKRVGFKFETFYIYKFRTMKINNGPLITTADDARITRWGRFLRVFKLDELPQLVNIIKGQMRFIGPRPEVPKYITIDKFSFLNIVPPGLSDYASIVFRNESIIMDNIGGADPYEKLLSCKILLAEYYSKKKGFLLDLKLVAYTLLAILFPDFTYKSFVLPIIEKDSPKLKMMLDKIV